MHISPAPKTLLLSRSKAADKIPFTCANFEIVLSAFLDMVDKMVLTIR